jgi:hypothetical protein
MSADALQRFGALGLSLFVAARARYARRALTHALRPAQFIPLVLLDRTQQRMSRLVAAAPLCRQGNEAETGYREVVGR